MHRYRPLDDEPDRRPLPFLGDTVGAESTVEALLGLPFGTRLEADLPGLPCSFVSSQTEQDGRVICAAELDRLMTQGLTPVETRNVSNFPAAVSPNSTRPKLARSGARSSTLVHDKVRAKHSEKIVLNGAGSKVGVHRRLLGGP